MPFSSDARHSRKRGCNAKLSLRVRRSRCPTRCPKPIERGDFDDGTAHIALQTGKEDFDRAVDELKKAGVKVLIDKPVARPMGRGLYFFDTEGNYVQLRCPE
jgi:hypothetical protein